MIVSSTLDGPKYIFKKLSEIQSVKAQIDKYRQAATSGAQNNSSNGEIVTTLDIQKQNEAAPLEQVKKLVDANQSPNDETVSDSDMEYVIEGKKFVYIQGQYLEARKDNIYTINGQKIFYVNNRGRDGRKDTKVSAA